MVDKNEKYRKTNLTNDRKKHKKRTYMTHSSMYKFTLIIKVNLYIDECVMYVLLSMNFFDRCCKSLLGR